MTTPEQRQWFHLGINSTIGIGNFFELIIQTSYTHLLQRGDAAIDGGANAGLHTLPMAQLVGSDGLVLGFEAIPTLARNLNERCRALTDANALIINKAIGATNGQTSFVHVAAADAYSGIRERPNIPEEARQSLQQITVPLVTMDQEYASFGHDRLRFIKLDLEGGEYDALRGATSLLHRYRPFVIFENARQHAADTYGYDRDSWFRLFAEVRYQVFDLFGRPFTPADWEHGGLPWYFIAVSRDEDLGFVNEKLPALIRLIVQAYCCHPQIAATLKDIN